MQTGKNKWSDTFRFKSSEDFFKQAGYLPLHKEEEIYIKRHFKRFKDSINLLNCIDFNSVLDVGCNLGVFLTMLGKNGVGIDRIDQVEVCKARGILAYPINLMSQHFPFSNEQFDLVVCLEVIEHLENPTLMFSEIKRVLKPDGYFLISTPNDKHAVWKLRDFLFSNSVIRKILTGKTINEDGWEDEKRYCEHDLKNLLISQGFEIIISKHIQIVLPSDDIIILSKKK